MKYNKNNEEITRLYTNIMNDIYSIKGLKIITFSDGNSFDFEDNKCEYLKEFKIFITETLKGNYGPLGIIIRQFTDDMIEIKNPKGNYMKIPKKNIYGLFLYKLNYRWYNDEEVFECFYQDNKTGEILEIDPDVTCCGFYRNNSSIVD